MQLLIKGEVKVEKHFPGYRLTCVKCTTTLDELMKIFGMKVIEGGYGCDFVVARLRITNFLGSCKIYGIKGEAESCRKAWKIIYWTNFRIIISLKPKFSLKINFKNQLQLTFRDSFGTR